MKQAMATETIDPAHYRHVMGQYPTGVSLITAIAASGEPVGMVVGTFTSVSLDPPLVAFLPDKKSSSFSKLRTAASFVVNVLASDQENVCRTFASKTGANKWDGVDWSLSGSGSPVIVGATTWIDCDFEDILDAGDHYIVVGRVQSMGINRTTSPLAFFNGGYGKFAADSLVAATEPDLISHLRIADTARSEMEKLAAVTGLECTAQVAVGDELVLIANAGAADAASASRNRVGMRLPFVPPFGALFVAWAPDALVEGWLGRLKLGPSAAERNNFMQILEKVRAQGWVVNLTPPPALASLVDKMFAGRDLDLKQQQELRDLVEGLGTQYMQGELDPEEPYDVRFVSAPVFDATGQVILVLRLFGLPPGTDGRTVSALRDKVMAAAERITVAVAGRVLAAREDSANRR